MESILLLRESGQKFIVKDTGGQGNCLFSSLAVVLEKDNHMQVRREIVNNITSEQYWPFYSFWAKHDFQINTRFDYSLKLNRAGENGTSLECRAASELYRRNINIVRLFNNDCYFLQEFVCSEQSTGIWLLFTGIDNSNGHFQLLVPTADELVEATLIAHRMESAHDNPREENFSTQGMETYNHSDEQNNIIIEEPMKLNTGIEECIDSDKENEVQGDNSGSETMIEAFLTSRNCLERKGEVLTIKEKIMVLKVRKYFESKKAASRRAGNRDFDNIVQRTAECLSISESTVKRITREAASGKIKKPHQKDGRPSIYVDSFFLGVIRRKIFDFYMNKEFPSIEKVLVKLREEVPDFPQMCRTTLRKLMKKINFVYAKLNKKPILMEGQKVVKHRRDYLRMIKFYREQEWSIFYLDESWCGANHTISTGWVEYAPHASTTTFDMYQDVQKIGNYRGGFLTPSGAGKRVILLHIGNESGFVESCMRCFIGKKGSADYHDEMNAKHFEEWFRHTLTVLPAKSIVVLDQAPYHTMTDPNFQNPTTRWRKSDVADWLVKRGAELPAEKSSFHAMKRDELYNLSRQYLHPKVYLLDTIAQEMRNGEVRLLWLPVAHCELNPIELIWAYVKKRVATANKTFKIHDVLTLCRDTMEDLPPNLWENCVRHAKKIEEEYRGERSEISQSIIENLSLVITVGEEDEDDDEDYVRLSEDDDVDYVGET